MSAIDYTWHKDAPPAPDVYTTRRNESRYLTLRYWDGTAWFEIGGGGRGGVPFTWPKKSRTRPYPWMRHFPCLHLRRIGKLQGAIQWGEPFKVYDEKEVLKYLVETNRLAPNWATLYQSEMRRFGGKLPTPSHSSGLGPVPIPRALLQEARDNCKASLAETGISHDRLVYRRDLLKRLDSTLGAMS